MPILEMKDVVSGYVEDIDVLRGVSIKVEEGKVTTLIGPNGAGKSTLLKTIFGILRPRRGKIFFKGEETNKSTVLDNINRGIAYLPQGRSNFPVMTVKENLEMGAFTRSDKELAEDIEKIMDRFPILREKRSELAGNMSGGEQQILEIGMALLLRPKLLMLDEPTLGLAPRVTETAFQEIRKINADGTTIIIVEQNAKMALSISHYAYALELGRKRFEGTAREIMNNPDVKKLFLGG